MPDQVGHDVSKVTVGHDVSKVTVGHDVSKLMVGHDVSKVTVGQFQIVIAGLTGNLLWNFHCINDF